MKNQKERSKVVDIYKRKREICHKMVDDIFNSYDKDIIETMKVTLSVYVLNVGVNKNCCD